MSCTVVACLLLGLGPGCSPQEPAMGSVPAAPAGANPPAAPPSEAERLTQTERLLADAKKDLAEVEAALADPESDYAKADAAFKQLDAKHAQHKKAVAKLKADGKADEAAKAEADAKALVAEWEQARDRFNLAITQRKGLQEKKAALVTQIAKHEQFLAELMYPPVPPAPGKTAPAAQPPATNPKGGETPAPAPADPKPPAVPIVPGVTGLPGVPAPPAAKDPPAAKPAEEDSEVRAARDTATARKSELAAAEEKAKSVEERVSVLQQLIATEERLLETERKVANQAEADSLRLTTQVATAAPADRPGLLARIADSQQRLAGARTRVAALTDRLSSLNESLRELQQERIEALQQVDAKRKGAEDAEDELTKLQNPFTLRNINKWLTTHGANMVLIVVGVLALHVVARQSSRQIVRFMARNSNRGTEQDRENRANTLVGVFRYAGSLVIFGGGIVMLLDEAGVPVVPLMGGAAVIGLAVAFGAQNLIKDYFSGFMMLLEDQYGVNDVVRIGSIAGLVEKITLRVTVLRDLEGVLHFIPHGQVTAVSNMTHGWSRAMFDVPVPHTADLNHVMAELVRLGQELRADPAFGLKIAEDPEMLGVEALDATASVVRFLVKTRPLQQWAVKRELLRRIKLRFDELGIELPPPRSTVNMVIRNADRGPDASEQSVPRVWAG